MRVKIKSVDLCDIVVNDLLGTFCGSLALGALDVTGLVSLAELYRELIRAVSDVAVGCDTVAQRTALLF